MAEPSSPVGEVTTPELLAPTFAPRSQFGLDVEAIGTVLALDLLIEFSNLCIQLVEGTSDVFVLGIQHRQALPTGKVGDEVVQASKRSIPRHERCRPPPFRTFVSEIRNRLAMKREVVEETRSLCLFDPTFDEVHRDPETPQV